MSLFEYLAIAFSLLFSFTSMRLVTGLPHVFQANRRYWIHACLVVCQLLLTVEIFWTFWSHKDTEWIFPTFLLVLLNPGLIYYNACLLVPESPSSVISWQDYFYSIRRRYYTALLLWQGVVMVMDVLVLEQSLFHPVRGFQIIWAGVVTTGALSDRHKVQAGVCLSLLFMEIFIGLTLALEPGSFAGQ